MLVVPQFTAIVFHLIKGLQKQRKNVRVTTVVSSDPICLHGNQLHSLRNLQVAKQSVDLW